MPMLATEFDDPLSPEPSAPARAAAIPMPEPRAEIEPDVPRAAFATPDMELLAAFIPTAVAAADFPRPLFAAVAVAAAEVADVATPFVAADARSIAASYAAVSALKRTTIWRSAIGASSLRYVVRWGTLGTRPSQDGEKL